MRPASSHSNTLLPMRYSVLPLQGSNLDSPDPEKGGARRGDLSSVRLRTFRASSESQRASSRAVDTRQSAHSEAASHHSSHCFLWYVEHTSTPRHYENWAPPVAQGVAAPPCATVRYGPPLARTLVSAARSASLKSFQRSGGAS